MASVNKAIILGNLGRDPEVRFTPSGKAVASFSVATTSRFKNQAGENQEQTEWHNIVLWGRLAEIAKEYLSKGSPVYVEGRIQTRSYQDKNGVQRYRTEIVGQSLQLLGRRGEAPAEEYAAPPPAEEPAAFDSSGEDDLPF